MKAMQHHLKRIYCTRMHMKKICSYETNLVALHTYQQWPNNEALERFNNDAHEIIRLK